MRPWSRWGAEVMCAKSSAVRCNTIATAHARRITAFRVAMHEDLLAVHCHLQSTRRLIWTSLLCGAVWRTSPPMQTDPQAGKMASLTTGIDVSQAKGHSKFCKIFNESHDAGFHNQTHGGPTELSHCRIEMIEGSVSSCRVFCFSMTLCMSLREFTIRPGDIC